MTFKSLCQCFLIVSKFLFMKRILKVSLLKTPSIVTININIIHIAHLHGHNIREKNTISLSCANVGLKMACIHKLNIICLSRSLSQANQIKDAYTHLLEVSYFSRKQCKDRSLMPSDKDPFIDIPGPIVYS